MAVQDIKVRVPAGETLPVQKPGDFIYLKFSDRKIAIIEDQSRFEMEAGDKYVSPNGFRDFQVQNLDQVNPVYVIFAVGKGDYNRQIVQGNITIQPGIRRQDGTFDTDARRDVTLSLYPKPGFTPTSYSPGDTVGSNLTAGGDETDYSAPDGFNWIAGVNKNAAASNHAGQVITTFVTYDKPGTALLKLENQNANSGTVIPVSFYEGGSHPSNLGLLNSGTILFSLGGIVGAGGINNEPDDYNLFKVASNGGIPAAVFTPDSGDRLTGGVFEFGGYIYAGYETDSTNARGLYKLNGDYAKVDKIDVGDTSGILWASDGKKIYSMRLVSGYPIREHDPDTLAVVKSYATNWAGSGTIAGLTLYEQRVAAWLNDAQDDTWENVQFTTASYTQSQAFYVGYARGGCPNISRNPGANDTGAQLSVKQNADGTETYSGEIVRAVLDALKADQQVTNNYRDHVYAMSVQGQPLAGFKSNGATMAAADIDDQFTVTMPASITVTIDNGLTYEGF